MQMEEVRVKFTDANEFQRTVKLDVQTGQLINEDRYVKKQIIQDFSYRLDTAFETVNAEIKEKMYFLLR